VRSTCLSLLAGLVISLAASGVALADETTPCPASQPAPTLSVVDPAGAGSLYATHVLRVNLKSAGTGTAEARSFTAPGARMFPRDDASGPSLLSETPGQLVVTAVVVIEDTEQLPSSDNYSCTTTVATTVTLQAPQPAVFGDFKRPHYLVPARRLYSPSPVFSFTVKPAKAAADQSPFTVLARGSSRLKVPGRRVKAASHDYPLRAFEFDEGDFRGCELLCSPETDRGFEKRVEVSASRLGSRAASGLKITVLGPTGLHFFARGEERFKPTPWGVDVTVLQSGHRIARLRVAARCDSFGQSSRCRFKKISTKL
jgi:hypothetical protein